MIKSRILRWVGHVARMEKSRSAFEIIAGKSVGCRRDYNVRIYLKIGVNTRNRIDSVQKGISGEFL